MQMQTTNIFLNSGKKCKIKANTLFILMSSPREMLDRKK